MQVSKTPYQDPITSAAHWLAIDFEPIKTFESPISLGANQDRANFARHRTYQTTKIIGNKIIKE